MAFKPSWGYRIISQWIQLAIYMRIKRSRREKSPLKSNLVPTLSTSGAWLANISIGANPDVFILITQDWDQSKHITLLSIFKLANSFNFKKSPLQATQNICSSSLTVSPSFHTYCYLYIQSYDSTPIREKFYGILYSHATCPVLLTFISYFTIYTTVFMPCVLLPTSLGSQTCALLLNIPTFLWFCTAWRWPF